MTREGVCIHGGLRRQCETCDLADRLEKMTQERDAWKRYSVAVENPKREQQPGDTYEPFKEAWQEYYAAREALQATGELQAAIGALNPREK